MHRVPIAPLHSRVHRLRPRTHALTRPYTAVQVLYREIDFDNERQAAEEFGANFKNFPSVKVPHYSTFVARRVVRLGVSLGANLGVSLGVSLV